MTICDLSVTPKFCCLCGSGHGAIWDTIRYPRQWVCFSCDPNCCNPRPLPVKGSPDGTSAARTRKLT